MYPLSHVIAPMEVWRQIMHLPDHVAKNFSLSALANEIEDEFGEKAFGKSARGNDVWYLDQKLISIRIKQWQERVEGNGKANSKCVCNVSNISFIKGSLILDSILKIHFPGMTIDCFYIKLTKAVLVNITSKNFEKQFSIC